MLREALLAAAQTAQQKAGVVVQADHVMVLDRANTLAAFDAAGIFLLGQVFEAQS